MMLTLILAGWINRQQDEMIKYLKEENKIFREKLGKKRILLNDNQRRWLSTSSLYFNVKVLNLQF